MPEPEPEPSVSGAGCSLSIEPECRSARFLFPCPTDLERSRYEALALPFGVIFTLVGLGCVVLMLAMLQSDLAWGRANPPPRRRLLVRLAYQSQYVSSRAAAVTIILSNGA